MSESIDFGTLSKGTAMSTRVETDEVYNKGFDAGFDTAGREERRFTAACAAMQGRLSEEAHPNAEIVGRAVVLADLLLAGLAKGENK